MERADEAPDRAPRGSISAAILAATASLPIVIAAGFLTDRPAAAVPGDISLQALRGPVDAPAARSVQAPARAD